MKITSWKTMMAHGRKSDLVVAVVLILTFLSYEYSDRSSSGIVKHCLVALGFIWIYIRYMKPADQAADTLSGALKEHGVEEGGTGTLALADAAADRLDGYAVEIARLEQESRMMKDQRLAEMSKTHQDLLAHHLITKKMLGSFRIEEVFEALIRGVRDGLGFHGAVLGTLDRDGNIVMREEFDIATGPTLVQIPAWSEGSVISGVLWNGKSLLAGSLDEQKHVREDRTVLGDGPFFLIPVQRKISSKCSDLKKCGSVDCSAYLSRNDRCWVEHHMDCFSNESFPPDERRKACVLCEMFSTAAILAVRSRPESRKVSSENVVPVVTLVTEAMMALEVVELHENMRKMSITDGLTGLYNHREFYQQLRRELERARRYRHTLSLLIIDVDDFKKFNDRFGHLAGDLALRKIADLLQSCARATDIVARYGGEEFAVILPESTSLGALMLAERIKTEVSNHDFLPQSNEEVHLTVSIGIYTAEEGAASEDQMVRLADEAAYGAKNTGKNRVVVKTHA